MPGSGPSPAQRLVADFLRAIPGHGQNTRDLTALCREAGLDHAQGEALITMLGVFGVLERNPSAEADHVRAVSLAAHFFLRSLAEYLESESSVLDNWDRLGTSDPPYTPQQALSGPQFLHLMERRRTAGDRNAPALRRTDVAQVVIKAPASGRGSDAYLLLYDNAARQYQLPGGHRRSSDVNLRETAIRELEEELPGFSFDSPADELIELGEVRVTQLSSTFGVSTDYLIAMFQLRSHRARIEAPPAARWFTEAELSRPGGSRRGEINVAGLTKLSEGLPNGLAGLGRSVHGQRRRSVRTMVGQHGWEVTGLVIGLLGILLSVLFFYLQT
ncbi:NUDIX hydrolase [Actinomadura alba]|uniref:NUDIX hydrolase n=1 Tax=Actinomadura alba TaxID=406431 RepID=UPI0031D66CD4